MEATEFVVMESGARWPRWAYSSDAEVPDRVVIAGSQNASPAELAQRALHHVTRAAIEGRQLRRVVVVLGPTGNAEVAETRYLLARALLTHMMLNGHGQLVLAAPDPLEPSEQGELLSLVGNLTRRLSGTGLTVSLRVGDDQLAPEVALSSEVRLRPAARRQVANVQSS